MGTSQLLKEITEVSNQLNNEKNAVMIGILEDYLCDLYEKLDEHEKDMEDYNRYMNGFDDEDKEYDYEDRLRAVGQ